MRPLDWMAPYQPRSWIHRMDPRARIAASVALVGSLVALDRPAPILAGLAGAMLLLISARFPFRQLMFRLAGVLTFCILLVLFMPLSIQAVPEWAVTFSPGLFREALLISARAAAAMLLLIALLGTIEPAALGHALIHLRVPEKLVQLYFFTIRYFDIVRREMQVMHTALLARGFRPALARRGWRPYGHLIGMLIVRSLDRSERVLRAMKCRGYCGHFYLFHHFHFTGKDVGFIVGAAFAAVGLLAWEML